MGRKLKLDEDFELGSIRGEISSAFEKCARAHSVSTVLRYVLKQLKSGKIRDSKKLREAILEYGAGL